VVPSIVAPLDGKPRLVAEYSWAVELHSCLVHIAERGGQWYVWLSHGGEWTERGLRVGWLADELKLARMPTLTKHGPTAAIPTRSTAGGFQPLERRHLGAGARVDVFRVPSDIDEFRRLTTF
jgi:hypothetical protein